MKKIVFSLIALVFVGWAGFALAQDDMNSIPKQAVKTVKPAASRAQQITNRIDEQTDKIKQGVEGKVIPAAEAKKYRAKLAAIRAQLKKYLRKNGRKRD